MKISNTHVLYMIILITLISSVYSFTNSVVFPEYKVGQCVKMFPFVGIQKIISKNGVNYVISNKLGQMDVSYNDLNNHFTVCECPVRSGVGSGKGWEVTK